MEINSQSPLNLVSELLIPIFPEEADKSELYVLNSFITKLLDYGWFSGGLSQLYFYRSSIEKRNTLLYQISKNHRLELIGSGHNFRFIKEDLCISIPRVFYNLNHLFKSFKALIHTNTYLCKFSIQSYFQCIDSYNLNIKIVSTSDSIILLKLNDRINLSIKESSYLFDITISDDISFFQFSHPKAWCEIEGYWALFEHLINGFKICN